jgi:hypothetical protein
MGYVRFGPDKDAEDRFRRDHIPIYGTVWNDALARLWPSESHSLRCISENLGVDPRTVVLQAARLGLSPQRPGSRTKRAERPDGGKSIVRPSMDPETAKSEWRTLIHDFPSASTSELRRLRPALYSFLWRHCHDWLQESNPLKLRPISGLERDWLSLDREVNSACREAAVDLRSAPVCVRLTQTAILQEAGYGWVSHRHLLRLPRTAAALKELTESRVDYAIRRVWSAYKKFRKSREPIPVWRLARAAGIRSDLIRYGAVSDALQKAARSLEKYVASVPKP